MDEIPFMSPSSVGIRVQDATNFDECTSDTISAQTDHHPVINEVSTLHLMFESSLPQEMFAERRYLG